MQIGIIGSGMIGSTVAKLAVDHGHTVKIANSRGPNTLGDLVAELGEGATAVEVADTAEGSDFVVVAIPLKAIGEIPVEPFDGVVVADANNYYSSRDGEIPELESGEKTSSELLADHLAGAKVVKAFNTMNFRKLADDGDSSKPEDERLALFVAGDDAAAKQVVEDFIEQAGFGAVDAGSLADGGKLEPESPVYGADLSVAEARAAL